MILANFNFMFILSDRSQGKQTGQEKELVLMRTERNGIPTWIIASLVKVPEFGRSKANSIATGMNNIFENQKNKFYMEKANCEKKTISYTEDGANANFRYSGVFI